MIDLKIADGIAGVLVQGLLSVHVLPILAGSVIKVHHAALYAGQRSLDLVVIAAWRIGVV